MMEMVTHHCTTHREEARMHVDLPAQRTDDARKAVLATYCLHMERTTTANSVKCGIERLPRGITRRRRLGAPEVEA